MRHGLFVAQLVWAQHTCAEGSYYGHGSYQTTGCYILRSRHPETNAQYLHTGGGVYCIFFGLPGGEVGLCGDVDIVWGCEIDDANGEYLRDVSLGLPVDGTTAEQLVSVIASKLNM